MHKANYVNDVTGLVSIKVKEILVPETVTQLCDIVKKQQGAISVGGGYFSMGGQTVTENSLHINMQALNKILDLNLENQTIRVQAGITWRNIQNFIDPHNYSVKIMQTYHNFTVGGSLSVNAHGRYVGQGPLILSVQSLKVVLANGELVEASPTINSQLFNGCIGGYCALGIIAEATLHIVHNTKIEREQIKLKITEYKKYFCDNIRNNVRAILHNADIYPPHYNRARSITWLETQKSVTRNQRLFKEKQSYPINRYFLWAVTSTPLGKWRRQYLIDPLLYLSNKVVWRNFEANNYNVVELEPRSRKKYTYALQEYFIPIVKFEKFHHAMTQILRDFKVNALNISIRHAKKDPGSILAWAKEEVFAFVLYHKQLTCETEQNKVAIWTRALIDAALCNDGSYYLPYQIHATSEQFHKAYPGAHALFTLKRQIDPYYKFRNKLWDKYYSNAIEEKLMTTTIDNSEFKTVFSNTALSDKFYLFLKNVYNIYPESDFYTLIKNACAHCQNDQEIYTYIQERLGTIKSVLTPIKYAIPALIKQKKEITNQTLALIGKNKTINGYVEIGTTGRYISQLRKFLKIKMPIYLINDIEPNYSPIDIVERGQIKKIGKFIPLNNYAVIGADDIKDNEIDLVTCYIGLHHIPTIDFENFIMSIYRILRKNGLFVLREHNVTNTQMHTFVSLAHTVFNAGLNIPWQENCNELRNFTSLYPIITYLEERGFRKMAETLLQEGDPTENTLLGFIKV